jgi:hypothetical protein
MQRAGTAERTILQATDCYKRLCLGWPSRQSVVEDGRSDATSTATGVTVAGDGLIERVRMKGRGHPIAGGER